MVWTHWLKCWSFTEAGVAMSSREAEFYGAVRGASTGFGMKALYRDIGYSLPLRLWTDGSGSCVTRNARAFGSSRGSGAASFR